MRAESLHPDVLLVTSAIWQTTCTVIRGPGREHASEAFVIDSPVLPEELSLLPGLLTDAGFPFTGLLATHRDWDHLLGRLAFPDGPLGVAESTADRLESELGAAQRSLRAFDEEHYLRRERPLGLGGLQRLPVPGKLEVGGGELELHRTAGHTADGMAIAAGWAGVLVVGDYLSPVEIPRLEGDGDAREYLATLERLEALVDRTHWIIPGHGGALERPRAQRILAEDAAYLHALLDGGEAPLPEGRTGAAAERVHRSNRERV